MSLAPLPKGDLHFGSRQRLHAPSSATGRTDFTRAASEAGKSHSWYFLSSAVVLKATAFGCWCGFESQLPSEEERASVFRETARPHSKAGGIIRC